MMKRERFLAVDCHGHIECSAGRPCGDRDWLASGHHSHGKALRWVTTGNNEKVLQSGALSLETLAG